MSEKKILEVQMLGSITVRYDRQPVVIPGGGILIKTLHLFLMLIYAGDKGVPRNELLNILYGHGECVNPAGDLRMVVSRLRKRLRDYGILDYADIVTSGGVYRWKGNGLEVRLDVREFEETAAQALRTGDTQTLTRACEIYGGDFLPIRSGEKWVAHIQANLREMYFNCLRQAADRLKERREYTALLRLASSACSLYPYEECWIMKIECLLAMKRYGEATALYNEVTNKYFSEGFEQSERMLEFFRMMNEKAYSVHSEHDIILDRLREKNGPDGAYFCSYPSFIDCCRTAVRMEEQMQLSHSLLCCELLDRKGNPLEERREDAEQELKQIFGEVLRRGDIYTCYSIGQYLVLLNGTDAVEAERTAERIEKAYRRNKKGRQTKLRCRIADEKTE